MGTSLLSTLPEGLTMGNSLMSTFSEGLTMGTNLLSTFSEGLMTDTALLLHCQLTFRLEEQTPREVKEEVSKTHITRHIFHTRHRST